MHRCLAERRSCSQEGGGYQSTDGTRLLRSKL